MKKLFKILAVIVFLFLLIFLVLPLMLSAFFAPKDSILASLPEYETKEFYSCNGFQDYTDYAKYTYQVSESVFTHSPYFRKVNEEDIPKLLSYIENFEGWVETCSDFPRESYDFDHSLIEVGDYFYILNRYEEPGKEFWNYNVYYFDFETQILYYFHNNI